MFRIMIIALVGTLVANHAHAGCMAVPDKVLEVTIDGVIAPVYTADGAVQKGCLLRSDKKTLGYTTSDMLCKAEGTRAKVKLSHGCCDTGPDSGDIECVVRSRSILGLGSTHGNGIWVTPTNDSVTQ